MDREIRETILTHCPGIASQLRAEVSISGELQFESCDLKIVTKVQQQKFIDQLQPTFEFFYPNFYVHVTGEAVGKKFLGGTINVNVVLNISELILNKKKYSILGRKLIPIPVRSYQNFEPYELEHFNKDSSVNFYMRMKNEPKKPPVDKDKPSVDNDKPSVDNDKQSKPTPVPVDPTNAASAKQGTVIVVISISMLLLLF